jgi:hypothetical protein
VVTEDDEHPQGDEETTAEVAEVTATKPSIGTKIALMLEWT